jgi:hypothetical protein
VTIAAEAIKTSVFDGNGSTTAFAFTFKTFLAADLVVTLTSTSSVETVQTITTHYTVALNSNQDSSPGGTVTMVTAPTAGSPAEKLVIANAPAFTQGVDLVSGGAFNANVIEDAIDRNTILARRAQELTTRSVQIPISDDTGTAVELPTETLRANKAVVFTSTGAVGISTDDFEDQATDAAASAAAASASATAAQSAASAVAVPFLMDTSSTTMSDPAGTNFRLNHATVSSVSLIAFGDTSEDGVDVTDYLMTWDDSTSTINGHLILVQEGTPANWAVFTVGAMTDNTDWVQCAVTYVDSGGSLFTNDVTVRCQFIRAGDKGETGATGTGSGLEMTWETTTTDTDQGVGKCWGNSGTISSISVFYMDDVDANSISVNSLVDSWDDSTNRDIRGTIVVKKQTAPENYHIFNVTGVVTSASTYSKIAVSYVLTSGTISDADAVFVEFARAGDQGTDAGLTMTFESTQTDTDQGAGKIFFNAAVASATIIYMDDLEQGGGSINDFVDSWDDSTSTVKGHVIMKKQDDLAVWALYSVSGSVTSASTYSKMTCAYIDGTGSFVDGNTVTVQFSRVGDKGTTGSTGAAGEATIADVLALG